jgi:hypothetical protein
VALLREAFRRGETAILMEQPTNDIPN